MSHHRGILFARLPAYYKYYYRREASPICLCPTLSPYMYQAYAQHQQGSKKFIRGKNFEDIQRTRTIGKFSVHLRCEMASTSVLRQAIAAAPQSVVPGAWEMAHHQFLQDLSQDEQNIFQNASPQTIIEDVRLAERAYKSNRLAFQLFTSIAIPPRVIIDGLYSCLVNLKRNLRNSNCSSMQSVNTRRLSTFCQTHIQS